MPQVPPPRWTVKEFADEIAKATAIFKEERITEPLEIYSDYFDDYRSAVEDLLEASTDLSRLDGVDDNFITDDDRRYALRYLSSPSISDHDLQVLSDADSFSRTALKNSPEFRGRIVDTVMAGLDRWRFPWVTEGREPTEAEKQTAVIATTALIASSRAQTFRRTSSKKAQEELTANTLKSIGFIEVPAREIKNLRNAPKPGEFCHESSLGGSKADIIAGLYDDRTLAIECKVSNSALNSVKRVNREAAAKATGWVRKFGTEQVIPAAVISGVFKTHKLLEAQDDDLTIFWAHDLEKMAIFIESTRP